LASLLEESGELLVGGVQGRREPSGQRLLGENTEAECLGPLVELRGLAERSGWICAPGPSLRADGNGDLARDLGPKELHPPDSFAHCDRPAACAQVGRDDGGLRVSGPSVQSGRDFVPQEAPSEGQELCRLCSIHTAWVEW
jgi:hypothetical protein